MRALAVSLLLVLAGCELEERADYLVGRECDRAIEESCDPAQRCLPHRYVGGSPTDFRCRDAASFERLSDGREPPLAFCAVDDGLECPAPLVCNADRVRTGDVGIRRMVCQKADNPFGPPL